MERRVRALALLAALLCVVIPKSLKVSPQAPPPVVPEGSDLVLACNVTRDLTHSTFLSVSWSVKKAASPEELLTFGPGEGVTVGVGVAQRFLDGGVRFLPGRNGVFQLVISRVMASDSGVYGCTGTEWTSENRKWVQIVQSVTEMGRVTVTPTDVWTPPLTNTSVCDVQGCRGLAAVIYHGVLVGVLVLSLVAGLLVSSVKKVSRHLEGAATSTASSPHMLQTEATAFRGRLREPSTSI